MALWAVMGWTNRFTLSRTRTQNYIYSSELAINYLLDTIRLSVLCNSLPGVSCYWLCQCKINCFYWSPGQISVSSVTHCWCRVTDEHNDYWDDFWRQRLCVISGTDFQVQPCSWDGEPLSCEELQQYEGSGYLDDEDCWIKSHAMIIIRAMMIL